MAFKIPLNAVRTFQMRRLEISFQALVLVFSIIVLSTASFSQSFNGIVRDATTKEVLPYANVGIRNKNIGGISDQNGAFGVDLSRAAGEDTVVISYIGYAPQARPISALDLTKNHVIELKPASHLLNEVVIRSKPEIIILGNKSRSARHTGWGDFISSRGRAIGLLIKAPGTPLKVSKLFFHLDACEFDSARVRINFLKVDEGNLTSFESQMENIFATIHKRKGWVEVPVLQSIVLRSDDILVAIEWVDAWAKPRPMEEGGSYLFTLSLAKSQGSRYIRQTPFEPMQLIKTEYTPSIYLECFPVRE